MEQAVLGFVMERPEFAALMLERLPLEYFGNGNQQIARAVASLYGDGMAFSPPDVVERLRVEGNLSVAGGLVMDCFEQGHLIIDGRQTIATLANLYGSRDASMLGSRLAQAAVNMDLPNWIDLAKREVDRIESFEQGARPPEVRTIDEFLTGEDLTTEWVMPGLLSRGTATMITAEEGVGKSTILRQFGLSAWAGMDPFRPWSTKYESARTLLIDCEVTESQLKGSLRGLWSYGNRFTDRPDPAMLRVESKQGGINLSAPSDQGWLHRVVREYKTELVVIGPVYRFTDEDLNTEEGVRTWQRCFEPMLADGVCVLTEHHAPNGAPGAVRALRPIGSSAMRRWFSQGLALRNLKCDAHTDYFCASCARAARVEAWRGSRDDEAKWPRYLKGAIGHPWWVEDEYAETEGSSNL